MSLCKLNVTNSGEQIEGLSIVVEGRFVTTGMSERRWTEGKHRRQGEGRGWLVWQHFRGSDTILLLDNKCDLISIVLQVLLGCKSVWKVRERRKKGGAGWASLSGINKK